MSSDRLQTHPYQWTEPEAYRAIEMVAFDIIDRNGGATICFDKHIAKRVLSKVRRATQRLMAQHQGDPAWEQAYRRWNETMYYKED